MARIELLKRSVGGIVTGSTHQNVTEESVPHPPAKFQLIPRNKPFHIPVTLQTGCSYAFRRYPNCGITAKKRFAKLLQRSCTHDEISSHINVPREGYSRHAKYQNGTMRTKILEVLVI